MSIENTSINQVTDDVARNSALKLIFNSGARQTGANA